MAVIDISDQPYHPKFIEQKLRFLLGHRRCEGAIAGS